MFPERRLRRLRTRALQPLFRETVLTRNDLIAPIFVDETISAPVPITSMPGQFRHSLEDVANHVRSLYDLGIRAVILFGIPAAKDAEATEAWNPDGIIQRTVRTLKNDFPAMVIITDVCACEYTDHGHCGIVGDTPCGPDLLNDPSLELMARIALSHAQAGADMVAPSCMLDGMVMAIREELDCGGYEDIPIMSYSTKFASALYGPFRDAADSGFSFGDRTTYQMSPANAREAYLESETDAKESADILMVKPAGMYLDVIANVATIGLPVAAYQVSGEYAMIKAAAANGWIDEKAVAMESLICIKRAGANLIITYFAEDAARWMNDEE
ncbi:delta-aminolevulinic acid dehydratase [Methanomicrobiaceae archaeon CYW5]|uniref:porphobilinogen synthase n=1 Tax=Methanovulcanius yangii TaxID=1789227 RepID=UPI0029CA8EE1|nr:porphobilinogen synthase [Methanovulcanius yangii]MBT8507734.1 delta-aminolevulinic acid dehydratase [Methanovulcanius yangii]